MNIQQIFDFAIEKGQEIEFEFTNLKGEIVKGRTLDAYLGIFKLGHHEGYVSRKQWVVITGDIFDFRIISSHTQ